MCQECVEEPATSCSTPACTGPGCSANCVAEGLNPFPVDGACRGTCIGQCTGGCTGSIVDGQCTGTCTGLCEGACQDHCEGTACSCTPNPITGAGCLPGDAAFPVTPGTCSCAGQCTGPGPGCNLLQGRGYTKADCEQECTANCECVSYHFNKKTTDCYHTTDATCSDDLPPLHKDGDVRLVPASNGADICSGRVEILHNDEWGTVCSNGWGLTDAHVVCRQLGCGEANQFYTDSTVFGRGTGEVWMDGGACAGGEPGLADCRTQPWGQTQPQCSDHGLDVGVSCAGPLIKPASPCACGLSNGPTCRKVVSNLCPLTCTSETTTTSTGDPHLTFAHGGRADFKGDHLGWYNMLSARNTSLNVLFVHDDFRNPNKLVHGSAMKGAAWKLRTNVTGRIVTVELNASSTLPNRALVRVSDSSVGVWIAHNGKPFVMENVRVEMKEKKQAGIGKHGMWHGTALIISSGRWRTDVWNKPFPNVASNPGKALLNIHVEPLYDADSDPVAPHGLIGQSYDGDGQAVNGATDDYTTREVTTQAMAEGAIEGKASDYRMQGKFEDEFRFARFNLLAAKPRDVSKLTGSKPRRKDGEPISTKAGAAADVED